MIAAASRILNHFGDPFEFNGGMKAETSGLHKMQDERVKAAKARKQQSLDARYDAASNDPEYRDHWKHADRLDADSANSKFVRETLVKRSRHETNNNGFQDGIVQSSANDIVGKGPMLRMQTSSAGFNRMVEREWTRWAKAIKYRRKLGCMGHAKCMDGESLGIVVHNPGVKHDVKLDIRLIETEQCQTPLLPYQTISYIDGVRINPETGDPLWYDILPHHPGSMLLGSLVTALTPVQVPADRVLHWFLLRRAGQHRGVPELTSTLNVGASSREFRESTVAGADTAARHSAVVETNLPPHSAPDNVEEFTEMPLKKRGALFLPKGWKANQMRSENPGTLYPEFIRTQVGETGRPKHMSYAKAANDYSNSSYASGRLDGLPYFASVDLERLDCEDLVLDPLFELWFAEAALVFGWFGGAAPSQIPDHAWDWPAHPVADRQSEASADDIELKNGSLSLSEHAAKKGQDFNERIELLARDYGCTPDEMRATLRTAIFNAQNQQASMQQAVNQGAAPDTKTVAAILSELLLLRAPREVAAHV